MLLTSYIWSPTMYSFTAKVCSPSEFLISETETGFDKNPSSFQRVGKTRRKEIIQHVCILTRSDPAAALRVLKSFSYFMQQNKQTVEIYVQLNARVAAVKSERTTSTLFKVWTKQLHLFSGQYSPLRFLQVRTLGLLLCRYVLAEKIYHFTQSCTHHVFTIISHTYPRHFRQGILAFLPKTKTVQKALINR